MPPSLSPTLQQQLDQITANTRALVQPERLARTEQNIAELHASGIESHALSIGAFGPNFSLAGANGILVRSEHLLALGPVVLKYFRGRWCPYDMTELETWQALLPTLRAPQRGRPALFVAVSPQLPRQNAFTMQNHAKPEGLTFPLLSDPACATAEHYGIAYTVPEGTRGWYRSMLVNLPLMNGDPPGRPDDAWRLPLPATFVLRPDGTIAFAEAHADHRVRPDPQEILEVLQGL